MTTADWDGSAYAQLNTLQRWVADRSLATMTLEGHERLLDIGCGDGAVTVELAALLPHGSVLGVDPSPRMVEVARARPEVRAGHLGFTLGAVQTMTFRDEFDVAVSFNALHWVADHQQALERIRLALVRGGSATLQMVCAGQRQSVEQTAMTVAADPTFSRFFDGFAAPFHHPDPDVFVAQARVAGLRSVGLTVDDLEWDFGSAEAFLAWCRVGFSDWLTRLPDEHSRSEFVQQVGDRYAEISGSTTIFRFLQMTAHFSAD